MARSPGSAFAPLPKVDPINHPKTVYTNSIAINLGRPEFSEHATGVAVNLSDESRKLAKQLKDAMQSGDEVAELRLTKAFVQSLTPEQREDVGRLIENLDDGD